MWVLREDNDNVEMQMLTGLKGWWIRLMRALLGTSLAKRSPIDKSVYVVY